MNDQPRSLKTYLLLGVVFAIAFSGYEAWNQSQAADEVEATPVASAAPGRTQWSEASGLDERTRRQRERTERLYTITTADYIAELTDLNASVRALRLRDRRFTGADGRAIDLVTTDREEYLPLAMVVRGVRIPADARFVGEQISPTEVRFSWEGNGFRVVRKIEAGRDRYQIVSTVRVQNLSRGPRPVRLVDTLHHYVTREAEGGGGFLGIGRPSTALSKGLCTARDDDFREDREALLDARGLPAPVFVGIEQAYFGLAIAQDIADREPFRCVVGADNRYVNGAEHGSLFNAELQHDRVVVRPGESAVYRTMIFAGPKDADALSSAGHGFSELLDLGFFGFIANGMNWLLGQIRNYVGNWGLAIILLTVFVKILLYPLTERSFQSMARMRLLKPEMDLVNEKYKDDAEAKGQAMMALYSKHKINPVAGCLPSLAQMPVWFALYQSLSTNVELFHAPFVGYVHDLSAPDRFFVMPLALGVLMYVQQKMTPQTMDPQQAKIMLYLMPGMITVFMLFLPAGLCVYMLTNSTLGIAQQKFIQWRLDRQVAEEAASKEAAEPEPAPAPEATKSPRTKKGDRRGRA